MFLAIAMFCLGCAVGSIGLAWLLWKAAQHRPETIAVEWRPITLEQPGAVAERLHGVRAGPLN